MLFVQSMPRGTGWSAIVGGLMIFAAAVAPTHAATVYFLVSERPGQSEHGDSFVLPLTESADILHARKLLQLGPDVAGAPIVFAEIMSGLDGVNRDLLKTGAPAWSWHVSAFEGFGDMGLELVDGWPTYIEFDVQGWIDNTSGQPDGPKDPTLPGHIGFWNYTITHELAGPPTRLRIVEPQPIPLPAAFPAGAMVLAGIALWKMR